MENKITIKEYLTKKGITFKESGGEIITACLFSDCDKESRDGEAHLYFNSENGLYNCKKCGVKGNLITLQKHLGDSIESKAKIYRGPVFSDGLVEQCHDDLPVGIRHYLNERGIMDEVINDHKLGYGSFYGGNYITIPISNDDGYSFFKLRQDPNDGDSKITYPKGEAQLYGQYAGEGKNQVICEGELDALALISRGFYALTSTHGAMTFKEEWVDENIKKAKAVYVCFDNDEAGKKGSERVLKILNTAGVKNIFCITLPKEVGDKGDITDYLIKLKLSPDDLFTTYAKSYPDKIDTSQFKEMTSGDIVKVLDLTIKKDDDNKITTLLGCLSAYTEDSQINISFNSPSSTGKSYTALEVAKLFPNEDVIKLGNCSKTAFFHEQGAYDKEKNEIMVDLSRKILIFTDMPHTGLLEGLRSFLSHDEKIMYSKITDKNQKGGNRTKTVALKGYPSVIFCSAGLKMDPQEMTRFILLSPENNQEKMKAGIISTILRESDNDKYKELLDSDSDRKLFKLRIQAIKQEKIGEIKIANYESVEKQFLYAERMLQPRHQRDIKKLISLIKSFALLNLWFRERTGDTITANDEDIKEAFALWEKISIPQELNIPPYVYEIYMQVFIPAFKEKNNKPNDYGFVAEEGITRSEIMQKYYQVFKRRINMNALKSDIIPTLDGAGLITRGKDEKDRRTEIIFITQFKDVSEVENNSAVESGVKSYEEEVDNDTPTLRGPIPREDMPF
jgi:hypothetical protein